MDLLSFLLIFLLICLTQAPWIWLLYRNQKFQNRLLVRNSQASLNQSKKVITELNQTVMIQAELMNQQQNQAMNLLSAKDPMSFQALAVTKTQTPSENSSDLNDKVDTPAQEQFDDVIRVRGHVTPDEAEWFRLEEGIEVDDRFIRH